MISKIICFLLGHKWRFYPVDTSFWDYKICDRCDKAIALSPYLTAGEKEYIDETLINAISENLIARSSLFKEKDENE